MSHIKRVLPVFLILSAALLSSGCSRSMINYQVAESIGTVGEHENNEPVETPKMQAEREQQEEEEKLEEERSGILLEAETLAAGYEYGEAIALLEGSEVLLGDERASSAISEYEKQQEALTPYTGDIVHLNFPNLIVDTDLAIDGDAYAQTYAQNLITLSEFTGILNELYENNYVLIDIHSLAEETADGYGDVSLTGVSPELPAGKKPLILSVENLNYASVKNGDGIATKLVLTEEGEVAAVYTDASGVSQTGAYDVVPVLEDFIAEHPDFSFRGARGIIGLSGSGGAFGYEVEEEETGSSLYFADSTAEKETEEEDDEMEENRQTVREIAEKLKEDGWTFASEGYSYSYMRDFTYEEVKEDIEKWQKSIGTLIGECDTLIYPYGSEVDYDSETAVYLIGEGYRYLIGLWASDDFLEVNEDYLRQTRRAITGYVLDNYASYFTQIFNASAIIDPAR